MKLKIFTSIYTIFLILGLFAGGSTGALAAKPSATPEPVIELIVPTPTPTPAPTIAPSYDSSEWIIAPPDQEQEIVAMLPLQDRTAVLVVWNAGTESITLMLATQQGLVSTDQSWPVGKTPSGITVTACARDLWVGVNGAVVATRHFELEAATCTCLPQGMTYIPVIMR